MSNSYQYVPASSMVELLALEELDRDLYRAVNEPLEKYAVAGVSLYGGQVAAQALRAAAATVEQDRPPHSFHGYFLRAGRPDRPILLKVERDRDGRSVSSRRVSAIQDGEVIFDLAASFHVGKPSGEYLPEVPDEKGAPTDYPICQRPDDHPFVEIHTVPPTRVAPVNGFEVSSRYWVKVKEALPDDPVIHACALVYMSDLGSGFAVVDDPTIPPGGTSLDHAMWFHKGIRADEWVLLDMWPLKAVSMRGLYAGSMHNQAGSLGVMLTQELLMREPKG